LNKGTHDCHAQVDIDIGATRFGPTGLRDKRFKVWMKEDLQWFLLQEKARGAIRGKNISIVRSRLYEKLTWRLFSTSGLWLTGIFTVGSCGGFP